MLLTFILMFSIVVLLALRMIIRYMDKRKKGKLHLSVRFRSFEFEVDTSSEDK